MKTRQNKNNKRTSNDVILVNKQKKTGSGEDAQIEKACVEIIEYAKGFQEGKTQALKDVEEIITEVYRCGTPGLFYLLEEIKSQLSNKKLGEE